MSSSALSVSILVPAYNEEGAIAETVSILMRQRASFKEFEIVVINDGSTDSTKEIAQKLPITYLEHPHNLGYGAALKTGLRHSKHEIIIIADADGTYPLEDIPKLAAEISQYDMVVGARTGKIVEIPLIRRPAKWMITRLAQYLSQQKIPDLNSGLRVFRREVALRFLPLYPDGFSFTTTITLAMLTNHYRVRFIPINYMRRVGKSSIHPIKDTINFIILIIRICAFFKPLNVFVPPAILMMIFGIIKGTVDYMHNGHLGLLSVSVGLAGFQMLFIGLLADLIDQRMKM